MQRKAKRSLMVSVKTRLSEHLNASEQKEKKLVDSCDHGETLSGTQAKIFIV